MMDTPASGRARHSSVNSAGLAVGCEALVLGPEHLGELPELISQAETVEDGLVLFPVTRPPFGGDAITPPCVGEFAQHGHGDGLPGSTPAEPPTNMLFRPEEIHGASGERDLVPP